MLPCRGVTCAVLLLLAISAAVQPAAAQSAATDIRFGFAPEPTDDPAVTALGYFVYWVEPGAGEAGHVRMTNPGQEPLTVALAAVDATTAQTGGSAYDPPGIEPDEVGTWLALSASSVTLEPGEERRVRFRVRVPDDAAPGQYLAGIAAHVPTADSAPTNEPQENVAAASINVQTRYVIAVEVDVPGDWKPSLTIEGVDLIDQPSGPMVGVRLRNDGSTFLKPTGTLTVTGEDGATVLQTPIEMGTFVTGTEVTYPVAWPGGARAGSYGARVALEYGDGQEATYEGTFTVGPEAGAAVGITALDVTEERDQASGDLEYVEVAVAVANTGATAPNARLTLHVTRDGQLIESFVLGSSLTLQPGANEVRQRYVAPDGWLPGTYAFAITLETVDPNTGQVTVLAVSEAERTVVVE